jgi:hypothetical protein
VKLAAIDDAAAAGYQLMGWISPDGTGQFQNFSVVCLVSA